MHERATPKSHGIDRRSVQFSRSVALPNRLGRSFSLSQTTLDGVVSTRPRVPQFTTAGLLDYIIELVVCKDKVRLPFRDLAID
jgi:hypothetical protein